MVRATLPRVDAQTDLYTRVLDTAGERPVVFRTLDVGSDKQLSYIGQADEENPAMGWRAIRIALDRPGLLRTQVRALLRAAAGRKLSIMFPMVADVAEFRAARALVDKEIARFTKHGRRLPETIRVGTMLEVPALAWQMPALLSEADFLSIGSNDLLQFLFAADRGNTLLAGRYDVLSPAALSFLKQVLSACRVADVPVSLCGEAAGHPLEAMALIGLGFRRLSMQPSSVGPVKEMILSLDTSKLGSYIETLLTSPDHSLRGKLQVFAQDHGIAI
jgi:phosphotransferase system enzyme I (PtsP)